MGTESSPVHFISILGLGVESRLPPFCNFAVNPLGNEYHFLHDPQPDPGNPFDALDPFLRLAHFNQVGEHDVVRDNPDLERLSNGPTNITVHHASVVSLTVKATSQLPGPGVLGQMDHAETEGGLSDVQLRNDLSRVVWRDEENQILCGSIGCVSQTETANADKGDHRAGICSRYTRAVPRVVSRGNHHSFRERAL